MKQERKGNSTTSVLQTATMRTIIRTLTAIVLLLAIAQGALLLFSVRTSELAAQLAGTQQTERGGTPILQRTLSRLPILPFNLGNRPLAAVIIENHEDARPHQQGLTQALLVQEWPVEGFISRFVAVLDTRQLPEIVGPVRSLRPYFVDGLLPWTMVVYHAGGSPEAYDRIASTAKLRSVNGLTGHYYGQFIRKEGISAPHDFFVLRESIEQDSRQAKLATVAWPPYSEGGMVNGESAQVIAVNYASKNHNVTYAYMPSTKRYLRANGEVNAQATPANVLFLEIPIQEIGAYGRLTIPTTGNGHALLFRDGMAYRGTWSRSRTNEWFSFTSEQGETLRFARGQTWMTILPSLSKVSWNNNETE